MKTLTYFPKNVCSRQIDIVVDDNDVIVSVKYTGGCGGNTQGLSALLVGYTKDEAIKRLEGIKCRGSRTGLTSCPDQLAQALKTLN